MLTAWALRLMKRDASAKPRLRFAQAQSRRRNRLVEISGVDRTIAASDHPGEDGSLKMRFGGSHRVRKSCLSLIGLCSFAMNAHNCLAEPNKVQYELEERCGSQAREIFEKDWKGNGIVNTQDGQIIATFQNHYNPTLNKCYYLLTSTSYLTKKVPPTSNVSLILLDVNENREIGEFMQGQQDRPTWCFVGDTTCRSKAEWQTLIKPFMER